MLLVQASSPQSNWPLASLSMPSAHCPDSLSGQTSTPALQFPGRQIFAVSAQPSCAQTSTSEGTVRQALTPGGQPSQLQQVVAATGAVPVASQSIPSTSPIRDEFAPTRRGLPLRAKGFKRLRRAREEDLVEWTFNTSLLRRSRWESG